MRRSPKPVATHRCPGACGRTVALNLYACNDCWRALPVIIRSAINAGYSRGPLSLSHVEAMRTAQEWYARRAYRQSIAESGR